MLPRMGVQYAGDPHPAVSKAPKGEAVSGPAAGKALSAWGGDLLSKEVGPSTAEGVYYAEQLIPDNERIKTLKDKILNIRKLPMFSTQSINAYDAVYLAAEARFSIADALENTHRLDSAFLKSLCVKTKAGPELLASPDRNVALPMDAGRIRMLVEAAARHYRYVVLDLCHTDPAVLDGLDPVKKIVVIANQELATVRSATRMAATLNQRYGKERVLVAVSRYDPNAGIGQEDIERVVGSKIRHLLPSDYRVALEALNTGRPMALSNQTRLAGALKALAHELAEVAAQPPSTSSGRSLFGRLTGRS